MLSTIKRCWRLLIILLTPIVLLPLPLLVHSSVSAVDADLVPLSTAF